MSASTEVRCRYRGASGVVPGQPTSLSLLARLASESSEDEAALELLARLQTMAPLDRQRLVGRWVKEMGYDAQVGERMLALAGCPV